MTMILKTRNSNLSKDQTKTLKRNKGIHLMILMTSLPIFNNYNVNDVLLKFLSLFTPFLFIRVSY